MYQQPCSAYSLGAGDLNLGPHICRENTCTLSIPTPLHFAPLPRSPGGTHLQKIGTLRFRLRRSKDVLESLLYCLLAGCSINQLPSLKNGDSNGPVAEADQQGNTLAVHHLHLINMG